VACHLSLRDLQVAFVKQLQVVMGDCFWGLVDYYCLMHMQTLWYTLTSIISSSVMSLPLLYPKILGNKCAQFQSPSLLSLSLSYITVLTLNYPPKNSNHVLTRITLSSFVIISALIFCYSIMSRVALILYLISLIPCIHVNVT
jgi:hypothetical protein